MIRSMALRTQPFSFRPLISVNNGRVAVLPSPVFSSTQICCSGSAQIRRLGTTQIRRSGSAQTRRSSLLDTEPSDNPDLFDILLTGVDHRILYGEVSEMLGCDYLSRTAKTLKPTPEINGILFGRHHRPFFTIPTTYEDLSYNLHFLFDTGSPFTYLSYDVSGNPRT
jgi:hypothetical protein